MKPIRKLTIVDDDDAFVFLTKELLSEADMVDNVNVFRNGKEALDFIETHKGNAQELPEILLLDLSMPVMDGWQFLNRFNQLTSELARPIAIYICTSSISPDDVAKARSVRTVSDFLVKPVTHENLFAMVKHVKRGNGFGSKQ